ncbi:hypothetical protein SAMN05421636_10146 [Pricia antarctica]|uniref:Uncharacterized protein n=1 Tax=Pricia antarctica TaxID=641691 RepID=A0A1G6VTR2_9FLAO|nr:hypothetical protein SAMN05421636_10146 [Pricia antarctica]
MGFGYKNPPNQQNDIKEASEQIEQGLTTACETFILKHR